MAPALAKHDPTSSADTLDAPSHPTIGARRRGPAKTPPMSSAPHGATEKIPQKLNSNPLRRGARLLVVDDSPVERALAASMLARAGFNVTLATGGEEAVRLTREALPPFDVVVMDMSMPEVDGLTATRAIRTLPDGRADVPIIALTANTDDDDRARCLAAGMNAHTAKPFSLPALLAAMRGHLRTI